ncbi:MAG: hypothetical protein ABIJ40_20925 [Bacteroidota bacterium]
MDYVMDGYYFNKLHSRYDKKQTSGVVYPLSPLVEYLTSDINKRYRIFMHNWDSISYDQCKAKGRLYEVGSENNGSVPFSASYLEKIIFDLEKQKRDEAVSCFRDVSRLRMDLFGVLNESSKNSYLLELMNLDY